MYKRISVLFLSFITMVAYGYALGGLFGYSYGHGRPLVIAAGLAGGTLSAWLAFKIWRSYLNDIDKQ